MGQSNDGATVGGPFLLVRARPLSLPPPRRVTDRVEACALGQPQVPAHPRHRARNRIRLQRRPVSVAEDQVQIAAVVRAELAAELVLADAVRLQACQYRWWQFDHAGLLRLGVLEL